MRKERVKHCKRKETPQRNHGGGGIKQQERRRHRSERKGPAREKEKSERDRTR